MLAALLLLTLAASRQSLLAQSRFEGFGAVTAGAASSPDGYTTFHVTSLADSGAGTLRDAVSQGKRHIVFDVAGTITILTDLNLYYSYTTIDGASAPAPGITILQPNSLNTTIFARDSAGVHDVVVQHLRVDGMAGGVHTNLGDIFGMDGQDGPVYNIVIDHVTGVASSDGVFDLWGRVYNVTISWNFIKDTVTALHFSRPQDVRENVSIHHNVFARNNERQIRIKYDSRLDFVNNVVWGWGWMSSGGAGLNVDTTYSVDPTLNVINNYYYASHGSADDAIRLDGGAGTSKIYMSGNIVPSGERDAVSTTPTPMPVPASAQVTTHAASALGNVVAPCVGMMYRNAGEQALLDEVSRGIGGTGGACSTASTPRPPTNVRIIR
jgi:pectate lyase